MNALNNGWPHLIAQLLAFLIMSCPYVLRSIYSPDPYLDWISGFWELLGMYVHNRRHGSKAHFDPHHRGSNEMMASVNHDIHGY
tara:strand:- start:3297 stop:3548 length:252 start_codon:yes stop_codon:yes gene_type:complete